MGESKVVVVCDGWRESCDQSAVSPYRFCQRHLDEYRADPWMPVLALKAA